MRKTQKILGLPIISISDGMEVGKVKSIIINAEKGAIDYMVVDSGVQIFSARIITNEDVLGIGEDALTIENEGVITDINRIPEAIQLFQKDIQIKGTKVLTKKGRMIGKIGDIYIDESDNCKITGLEFIADITQEKVQIIPSDCVITFGKNLTVVKDDVESALLDAPHQLGSDDGLPEYTDTFISSGEFVYREASSEIPCKTEDAITSEVDGKNNAAILFEQRQRQYLKGRRAAKTIADSSGSIIISDGMLIDDQVIDEAKLKGKLIELVMNNRV